MIVSITGILGNILTSQPEFYSIETVNPRPPALNWSGWITRGRYWCSDKLFQHVKL